MSNFQSGGSASRGDLAKLFAFFRRRLTEEAANDPEPETRLSPVWHAWRSRHWNRERRRAELAEAEAFSTDPHDPAPLAEEGFEPFIAWVKRRNQREGGPT